MNSSLSGLPEMCDQKLKQSVRKSLGSVRGGRSSTPVLPSTRCLFREGWSAKSSSSPEPSSSDSRPFFAERRRFFLPFLPFILFFFDVDEAAESASASESTSSLPPSSSD